MNEQDPTGCLGCNTEKVKAFLLSKGVSLNRFHEVPRPRHKWGDVVCCDECGRAWLIAPEKQIAVEPS